MVPPHLAIVQNSKPAYKVWVSPLNRNHVGRCSQISKAVHGDTPDTMEELVEFLADMENHGNCGVVATVSNRNAAVGYCTFARCGQSVFVHSIGVDVNFQRKQIGSEMVRHLQESPGVETVEVQVPERNTGGCMFFKANGFKCRLPIVYGMPGMGDEGVLNFLWESKE
jgi:ribosomal protein S18 acetylase RimI-like enzyme